MTTVLAYLDPGSGSMILQILAGGLAAVAVTAKLYWNRILKFLRIRKDEPEAAKSAEPAGTDRLRLAPQPGALRRASAPAETSRRRPSMSPPPTRPSAPAGLEPGSFRDPESRVFYSGDEVYRALSKEGLEDFEALEASGLLDDERLVRTERVEDAARAERPAGARAARACSRTSASRSCPTRTSGRSRC